MNTTSREGVPAAVTGLRPLIEIAAEACAPGVPPERCCLVTADAAELAARGAGAVVREALAGDRTARTAADVARLGATLQVMVLVERAEPNCGRVWVVDGWQLLRAHGAGADLRGAPLRGARLAAARLGSADLSEADLRTADLEKADLSGANLTGADLTGACLFSASLQKTDLTESSLCRVDLRHADLREAVFVHTAMRGADVWEAYLWNVDISQAFTEGLDVGRADFLNAKVERE